MVKGVLAGLVIMISPVALHAQSLGASAVIPPQYLLPRDTARVRLAATAIQPPASTAVTCDMPVATGGVPNSGVVTESGGIAEPQNHGVPIVTAHSACRNAIGPNRSDSAESNPR